MINMVCLEKTIQMNQSDQILKKTLGVSFLKDLSTVPLGSFQRVVFKPQEGRLFSFLA